MAVKKNYTQSIEVVGAYGRSYKSLTSARVDWLAEKDFQTTTGPYVNVNDAERYNLNVILRFGQNNGKLGTLR